MADYTATVNNLLPSFEKTYPGITGLVNEVPGASNYIGSAYIRAMLSTRDPAYAEKQASEQAKTIYSDPVAFVKNQLRLNTYQYSNSALWGQTPPPDVKPLVESGIKYLQSKKIDNTQIRSIVDDAVKQSSEDQKRVISYFPPDEGNSWFDKLLPIVPLALNYVAPGFGTAMSAITAVGQGADIGDILKNVAISQGISQGLNALGAGTADAVDLNAATADLQNVYGGALPIEDIAAAFDTVSPLVDTTVSLDTTAPNIPTQVDTAFVQDMSQGIEQPSPLAATDTSFLQDMDQGIQPEVNLEGGDLGMTEAEAQNQYYESIGIDPSTVTDTPAVSTTGDTPETDYSETSQQDVSKSLTPQQIYNLLKIGAGLFGGANAISTVAKNITGKTTSNAPTGTILPTVKAPTPFTGTYSGMNPYDAAYFQQVQQNYNRLFPTVPTNVATPLQSWYQTQYKPDTTISNKLFGV